MHDRRQVLFGIAEAGQQTLQTPQAEIDQLRMQRLQTFDNSLDPAQAAFS
jgi:hypothetical protein